MNIEDTFMQSSYDIMNYRIQDVSADGACLYRCMARFIYDNYDKLEDIIRRNGLDSIVKIMKGNQEKPNYDWYIETDLAKEIQNIVVSWLIEHNENDVENQGCSIRDIIEVCHEMEYEKYTKLYKIFAGDSDFYLVDSGKVYQKGKKKGQQIYEKIYIPTRWGGFPEQFAFHKIFDVNINIYIARKYDKKTNELVKANSLKNARFSLIENIGETGYLDAEFLLLDKKANHFLYLIRRNCDDASQK